jgi:hypothetical protein
MFLRVYPIKKAIAPNEAIFKPLVILDVNPFVAINVPVIAKKPKIKILKNKQHPLSQEYHRCYLSKVNL